jgi:hypothetical protein
MWNSNKPQWQMYSSFLVRRDTKVFGAMCVEFCIEVCHEHIYTFWTKQFHMSAIKNVVTVPNF